MIYSTLSFYVRQSVFTYSALQYCLHLDFKRWRYEIAMTLFVYRWYETHLHMIDREIISIAWQYTGIIILIIKMTDYIDDIVYVFHIPIFRCFGMWTSPLHYHVYEERCNHYNDVIMSAMAPQITSLTIVYSTVHSGTYQRKKTSQLLVTGLCARNSPVTGEFPAQMASNAEKVSIWWRHHDIYQLCVRYLTKHRAQLFDGDTLTINIQL